MSLEGDGNPVMENFAIVNWKLEREKANLKTQKTNKKGEQFVDFNISMVWRTRSLYLAMQKQKNGWRNK